MHLPNLVQILGWLPLLGVHLAPFSWFPIGHLVCIGWLCCNVFDRVSSFKVKLSESFAVVVEICIFGTYSSQSEVLTIRSFSFTWLVL